MERLLGPLGVVAILLYMGVGLVQLAAVYSFFYDSWGWYWIFAAPAAFVVGYLPIIGSICGILAAHDIWHWPWWKAVLLFCWPVLAFLAALLSGISLPFGKKQHTPVAVPKEPSAQTIDIAPAPVSPAPQQDFAPDQNSEPPSPQETPQEQASGKSPAPARPGFFYNLRMGNYSLAKTFWLYGVVVFFFSRMFFKLLTAPDIVLAIWGQFGEGGGYLIYIGLEVIAIIYSIIVFIGVWRAADKYTGNTAWKWLAKIMVIIWWCNLGLTVSQEVNAFLN